FSMGRLSLAFAMLAVMAAAVPAEAGTISYTYDQLGRLSQVAYPSGTVIRYNYDVLGNRTSYVVTGSTNSPPSGTPPIGRAQIVSGGTVQPAAMQSNQSTATPPK